MEREERMALAWLLGAVVVHVLSGCQPAPMPVTWDAGLDEGPREVVMQEARGCAPAWYPEPPEEVRGRCTGELSGCLRGALDEGECYYAEAGECAECVEHARAACATERGGCADAYGAIACCRASACAADDGPCLQRALLPGGACHAAVTQFEECVRASTRDGPCDAVPATCMAGGR